MTSMGKENNSKKDQTAVIELGDVADKETLLLGQDTKQFNYTNSLSSREMESLTAICDTFLPSIKVSGLATVSDDVSTFFQSSASMAGTPERLGGLISERLNHPKKWLVRLSLWFLSTSMGTLVLCGRTSVCSKFPYFRRFPELSQRQREETLRSWSLSYFYLLRMLYKALKLLTCLVFFSQVDEKNQNLSWKAIGYNGPDPKFSKKSTREDCKKQEEEEEFHGPLYKGLINMKLPRHVISNKLHKLGFSVSTHNKNLLIRCDAVVVGSGSGGGVIAGVLAKAGYKVIVLEKGNYYARKNLSLLEGPTMDQMYLSGGLLATADMGVVVMAGSTVGGGSTINWSASFRTPENVIKEWCDEYGLELFGSKLYEEAMDVVCEKMGVQSEFIEEGFNNAILRRGCNELGYPIKTIPRNAPPDHYCGWCCLGCKDGRKKGTSETWLVDMVDSGNGVILPGCEVIKVITEKKQRKYGGKMATGVVFEFENKQGVKDICAVESKITVVSCGALSTPALLKRSGLRNSNIGKNLHLHPVTMAWGYFRDSTLEKGKKSYEGGIMTAMSDSEKSKYGVILQTPALHPGMFSGLIPWVSGSDIKVRMCKYSRTAHVFALARDKGSGTVDSSNSISYRIDGSDEENLQKGLEKLLRILAAAGAEEIGTHHCEGRTLNVTRASAREFESFVEEESRKGLRDLLTPICSAHQMGSSRMGVDWEKSVVDQTGMTWEVEGLYVADTSVFPTALGVNPMVTVMAIAYCTAKSVVGVLSREKPKC